MEKGIPLSEYTERERSRMRRVKKFNDGWMTVGFSESDAVLLWGGKGVVITVLGAWMVVQDPTRVVN
jgi:hypothetical protein